MTANDQGNKTKITAEAGKLELLVTREFDAPREIVFRAFTDPELYVQWLGPRELTSLKVFDAKKGGIWRYILKDTDGSEYAFNGVFHEVVAPVRFINTFEFEGLPHKRGHVSLKTARFEALPVDRTLFTSQTIYQSLADRDGELKTNMEIELSDSFDRLDALLVKLIR